MQARIAIGAPTRGASPVAGLHAGPRAGRKGSLERSLRGPCAQEAPRLRGPDAEPTRARRAARSSARLGSGRRWICRRDPPVFERFSSSAREESCPSRCRSSASGAVERAIERHAAAMLGNSCSTTSSSTWTSARPASVSSRRISSGSLSCSPIWWLASEPVRFASTRSPTSRRGVERRRPPLQRNREDAEARWKSDASARRRQDTPRVSPFQYLDRSSRLSIFPAALLGSASMKSTVFGHL